MLDRRERAALDRYITGNYGEDQMQSDEEMDAAINDMEEQYPSEEDMDRAFALATRMHFIPEVVRHVMRLLAAKAISPGVVIPALYRWQNRMPPLEDDLVMLMCFEVFTETQDRIRRGFPRV